MVNTQITQSKYIISNNIGHCHITDKDFEFLAEGISKRLKKLENLKVINNKLVNVSRETMEKLKNLKKIEFVDMKKYQTSLLSIHSDYILRIFAKQNKKVWLMH